MTEKDRAMKKSVIRHDDMPATTVPTQPQFEPGRCSMSPDRQA